MPKNPIGEGTLWAQKHFFSNQKTSKYDVHFSQLKFVRKKVALCRKTFWSQIVSRTLVNTMKNSNGVPSNLRGLLGYLLDFRCKVCKKWTIQCESVVLKKTLFQKAPTKNIGSVPDSNP